jgi:hypothetical protein
MRLLLGIAVGLITGLGGALAYHCLETRRDPCLGRCGEGTRCERGACRAIPETPAPPSRARFRHARRPKRSAGSGDVAPTRRPSAAELAIVTSGPPLKTTDVLDLAQQERGPGRELSAEEVTPRFRRLDPGIVACIDRARGAWDIDRGKVEISFRIERSGRVDRVRVSAPAVMQRAGLTECVRPLVQGLRFPETARALVMSFPYALE